MDGFTCPNRDGFKGTDGCIFCSEKGSGEHIKSRTCNNASTSAAITSNNTNFSFISEQVKNFFTSYKSQRANKFIAYFQNYTNTYDTIENLKNKYDSALIDNRIIGLEVATRPDCINEDIAKLLKSYSDKYYVCVELGLQTANEEVGNYINRCYSNKDFTNAVSLLNKYNIDVVTHIIIGLPVPSHNTANQFLDYSLNSPNQFKISNDTKQTVDFLKCHKLQGLKIHSCYVVKNTKLEKLYYEKKYIPLALNEYLTECAYVLTHINPEIVIHRISGDSPKDLLVAPHWNLHKKWILNGLDKYLKENDLWQGKYFKN